MVRARVRYLLTSRPTSCSRTACSQSPSSPAQHFRVLWFHFIGLPSRYLMKLLHQGGTHAKTLSWGRPHITHWFWTFERKGNVAGTENRDCLITYEVLVGSSIASSRYLACCASTSRQEVLRFASRI